MHRKALWIQAVVAPTVWLVLSALGARANAVQAFDRYGLLFAGCWAVMIGAAGYYVAKVIWPLYRQFWRRLQYEGRRPK